MLEAKRRATIFFILAFILAAATGYMVLQKVEDLNSDLGAMTKVYIAKGNIDPRTLIKKNQVTVMEIPNKFVIKDSHITSFEDLENRVSVLPLANGDMITKSMIKPASTLQDENNRLVSLSSTEKIRFDQIIESLDRVDIVVSTENNGKRSTSVFMKDVLVRFAVGTEDSMAGISVEVTAEDAPKLIHMQNYADHIRILKANVGINAVPTDEKEANTGTSETKVEEKPATEKPAAKTPTESAPSTETPKEGTPATGSGQ